MNELYTSDDAAAVVDTNVLMDFYELGSLKILFDCFSIVVIPKQIYDDELLEGLIDQIEDEQLSYHISSIRTEKGLELYRILTNDDAHRSLSQYDRFAIAIAGENHFYCTSNDAPVRQSCHMLDADCTGTLGVLGRCYVKELITEKELLGILDLLLSDQTSCYIREDIIEEFKIDLLN